MPVASMVTFVMRANNPTMPERFRHRFTLNPYDDFACSRCPDCQRLTKLRKFALAIHIEPAVFLMLNKSCRFCPPCDLLIGRKCEIEALMHAQFTETHPEIVGNKYTVFGTLDRADWRKHHDRNPTVDDVFDLVYVFKEVDELKLTGGWGPAEPLLHRQPHGDGQGCAGED